MNRIAKKLLEQSSGDKLFHRKDILSVLAQANSMEGKAHQMNHEDVRSRAYKPMLDWCITLLMYTLRDPYFHRRWS